MLEKNSKKILKNYFRIFRWKFRINFWSFFFRFFFSKNKKKSKIFRQTAGTTETAYTLKLFSPSAQHLHAVCACVSTVSSKWVVSRYIKTRLNYERVGNLVVVKIHRLQLVWILPLKMYSFILRCAHYIVIARAQLQATKDVETTTPEGHAILTAIIWCIQRFQSCTILLRRFRQVEMRFTLPRFTICLRWGTIYRTAYAVSECIFTISTKISMRFGPSHSSNRMTFTETVLFHPVLTVGMRFENLCGFDKTVCCFFS